MEESQVERLYQILDKMEKQGKNPKKIQEIRGLIRNGNYIDALESINNFNNQINQEYDEYDEDDEILEAQDEEENIKTIYPKKLENHELEEIYIGILLNNPKLITKYYILYQDCFFQDEDLLNIYKSIIYTEGAAYTPEIAKKGFNFSRDSLDVYDLKQKLKEKVRIRKYNVEKVYAEIYKLFILRRNFLEEPVVDIQEKIAEIIEYDLYDKMSIDEVKNAIEQVSVTQKFKQAVLNDYLTEFLESDENNLANGLRLPFPILSEVFKGIRKGETMSFAMPSNAGKSRFTINLAAFVALVHKKKVLVISNEMSEEKMKLCLITTILNNVEIQKIHGHNIRKSETELLEFKFRPDNPKDAKLDENGFILPEEGEKRKDFVKRLTKISSEFDKIIEVTNWVEKELKNSIYFINITDHTNDELQKVIMNYYYKEKIEYVFYDTLKTDTANIGNGEEIKRTATILSNIAQNFGIYIFSTLQLMENTTEPINLSINDLAVSRTVKEVLDTLCLLKQIDKGALDKYEYSLEEVDTKFYDLEKYDDPNVRYYACVVDKNRAGAKPKVLFRINLAYNAWEELGYLKLKE